MQEQFPIKEIEDKVRSWTAKNVSKSFEFRPGQFESIVGIIYSILNNGLQNNILQAPTGTGKSFICIISAGVLADHYDIKSYILASDLYLWKQYADAIDKFKLKSFGYMKGSMGNYRCSMNFQDYELGECKLKKVSLKKFRHDKEWSANKWPCSLTCQYLLDRFRAEKSPVTLMTYQLWLYQMNLVRNDDPCDGFTQRDVIFCDECHNIPDIVSKFAQPQISVKYDRNKILVIADYMRRKKIAMTWHPQYMPATLSKNFHKFKVNDFKAKHVSCDTGLDIDAVMSSFDYTVDSLNCMLKEIPIATKTPIKTDILVEYVNLLDCLAELCEDAVKTYDSDTNKDHASDNSELRILNWMHNYFSSFIQFLIAVQNSGQQYVIVEKTEDDDLLPTFTFYCAKEDYLCSEYLLSKARYKVMTSATVGNINAYMTNIGIDINKINEEQNLVAYTSLPNIFDFKHSPIFYLPTYKMSFKEKVKSFPEIQKMIYKICEMYPDVHGMINTGSYMNSKIIINNAPPKIKKRLCGYDSAKNKEEQIKRFMSADNKILIGPTLVEGVDLPGDLCRFIIIAKLPYPSLTSPMTKAKMNLFPLWYSSTTSNTMIQNIGRGVRFQGDWCYTFILDGCFDALYNQTYSQYALEIQNRFVRITPEYILENHKKIIESQN